MANCPCAALLKLLLITLLIYIYIHTHKCLIYYTYFCNSVVNPTNSKNCHKYAMTGNITELILVCIFISATYFDLTVGHHQALQFV